MFRSITLPVCLLMLGACTSVMTPNPQYPEGQQDAVVAGNTAFALDLYKQISSDVETSGQNIFISPASIYTAFGLVYPGASGTTAQEMKTSLHITHDMAAHSSALGDLLKTIQVTSEGQRVAINNALWVDQTSVLEKPYLNLVKTAFDAAEKRVDYINNWNEARRTINMWVEDKTEDRIKDLLPASAVTAETRNILVNTIYLDADWQSAFAKEATRKADFFLAPGKPVQIDMMSQTALFQYADLDDVKTLALPYVGNNLSMAILLPDEASSLKDLETRLLQPGQLEEILTDLDTADRKQIALQLPKLKIEDRFELSDAMKALGMQTAFSNRADFSAMAVPSKQIDGAGFKIDKVIHQTFLEVDEKGTEAAAATAITMVRTTSARMPPPPIPFTVNRPHILILRHTPTGMILFMGRIQDPQKGQ